MIKCKVNEEKLIRIIKAIYNNYSKEVFDVNTYCHHIDFIHHILENAKSVYAFLLNNITDVYGGAQGMIFEIFNKNKIDDFVKAVVKQYNKGNIDNYKFWDLLDKCEKLYGKAVYIIPYYNLEKTHVVYIEIRNVDKLTSYKIIIKDEEKMLSLYYNNQLIYSLNTSNLFTVDVIMYFAGITEEDIKNETGAEEIDYERFDVIIE